MWLPSPLKLAGVAAGLLAVTALAACSSVTPVYAPDKSTAQLAVIYAKPGSRLEQIVYEDLALKLGKATSNAPVLTVKVTSVSRALTSTDLHPTLPATQQEEEVIGDIRLTDVNGKVIFSGMRSATADYTANSQGLATDRAEADATVRGAHALAETIRLTLLGVLAK